MHTFYFSVEENRDGKFGAQNRNIVPGPRIGKSGPEHRVRTFLYHNIVKRPLGEMITIRFHCSPAQPLAQRFPNFLSAVPFLNQI